MDTFPERHASSSVYDTVVASPRSISNVFHMLRRLGGGGTGSYIDFTVLAVVVITLGLLLLVELFRHRLDRAATGRPFFTSVLGGVYRELSTLGMVEFVIFLLHTYYKDFDLAQEQVFAKVHFTFFFTAIINALQSVLLAFCSSRVSNRLWVRTEQLEVDHYVELREEFERLQLELSSGTEDGSVEPTFQCNFREVKRLWNGIVFTFRHPRLKGKHDKLLVQVRFHELRVHFLKANDLPLNFKVSDYLKRSELDVMKKLVHISTFAWLLLMGAVNLAYFSMGMVTYVTESLEVVGKCLSGIYFGSLFVFVLISLIIFVKMKKIFKHIIEMKLIDVSADDAGQPRSGFFSFRKYVSQLDLFWGRDPRYIIGMIQFMQFGFAIGISILLVFWQEIDPGRVPAQRFLLVVSLCYIAFVIIMARVIPQFTLCTSLGELVNTRRLRETQAASHLEETRRKQQVLRDVKDAEETSLLKNVHKEELNASHQDLARPDAEDDSKLSGSRVTNNLPKPGMGAVDVAQSSLASALDLATGTWKENYAQTRFRADSDSSDANRTLLAELAQKKTEDLRICAPPEVYATKRHEEKIKDRRARRKAVSDGVAAMRRMTSGKMSAAASNTLENVDEDDLETISIPPTAESVGSRPRSRRSRRKKSLSANAAIELMQNLTFTDQNETLPPTDGPPGVLRTGVAPLHPLIEDIPVMAVSAAELPVQLGRENLPDIGTDEPDGVRIPSRLPSIQNSNDGLNGNVSPDRDGDQDTIDTAGSEHSDADDIPAVAPSKPSPIKPVLTFHDRCHMLFSSYKYRLISGVFGTMICFFLVGLRVEALLLATGTIGDTKNTWDISVGTAFWMECTWLSMFILVSSLNALVFRPGHARDDKEGELYFAGLMDILISAACLILLMASEIQRCCNENEERLLGEATGEAVECSCLAFGHRIYGGVGDIEPFTSLIALRIFRFILARKVVEFTNRSCHPEEQEVQIGDTVRHHLGAFAPTVRKDDVKSLKDDNGTAEELWEHAIGLYPEIVAKYGEFSGELLKAMLGIDIIDEESPMRSKSGSVAETLPSLPPTPGAAGATADVWLNMETTPMSPDGEIAPDAADSQTKTPLTVEHRYSALPMEAQSIILAGKLGKPVRSISNASVSEDGDNTSNTCSPSRRVVRPFGSGPESWRRAPLAPLEFEVDADQYATEMQDTAHKPETAQREFSSFIAPNAPLIRSMRRCDRKMRPLLQKWTAVDVVITKYELVYFSCDVNGDEKGEETPEECAMRRKRENVRQALIATKGGKGLRLCDVAEGRKVVGRLALSAVEGIHVERSMPRAQPGDKEEVDTPPELKHVPDEYWKVPSSTDDAMEKMPRLSREHRWERVKEDHLKIESSHGILHLRFYSDLEDTEMNMERSRNENEDEGPIFKNNALQWCQTIVRLCGTGQLKQQKLPHYGDDNSDELRDYLEVIVYSMHDAKVNNKKALFMRRVSSFHDLAAEGFGVKKQGHRRFYSTGAESLPSVNGSVADAV